MIRRLSEVQDEYCPSLRRGSPLRDLRVRRLHPGLDNCANARGLVTLRRMTGVAAPDDAEFSCRAFTRSSNVPEEQPQAAARRSGRGQSSSPRQGPSHRRPRPFGRQQGAGQHHRGDFLSARFDRVALERIGFAQLAFDFPELQLVVPASGIQFGQVQRRAPSRGSQQTGPQAQFAAGDGRGAPRARGFRAPPAGRRSGADASAHAPRTPHGADCHRAAAEHVGLTEARRASRK